ncbi:helix-turn-helix transcriptional regulator [Candidatus Microgenomates bacterium]|nr:helix-turn-helix transcriptional regulator [Candidatus Microgenomates bacterium]
MKKVKWTTHKEFKKELLSNPKTKKAYDDLETEFQISRQIINARLKNKMTQEDLAKKANTAQAVISRLEGMNAKPSISLLARVARALDTKIELSIQ